MGKEDFTFGIIPIFIFSLTRPFVVILILKRLPSHFERIIDRRLPYQMFRNLLGSHFGPDMISVCRKVRRNADVALGASDEIRGVLLLLGGMSTIVPQERVQGS